MQSSYLKKSAGAAVAVAAFLSLTVPSYHRFAAYPKQEAGHYLFFGQRATIDWSITIHDFLWLSMVVFGVLWLVPKVSRGIWIRLGAAAIVLWVATIAYMVYVNSRDAKPPSAKPIVNLSEEFSSP
jgi:hypothetical protein